ncbi:MULTISPECIES: prohibitin family protein [unclassified Nitrosarchaeum]|uniref:prohibitin family protein n=1 Tax=unclassified Nitrosarchaeum TaxID=2641124 RepID=UPI0015C9362A|nr:MULTISPECIES: prohibitin family protein [unclassified Nitrosarchaeum]MCV0412289.1 prohibitin family protein [Nitrosarchaeum sp.]QLH10674.1 prohibitin family protein [Nitrosarchaeum sp. AC2]HSA76595.1 prohibitin family protein [Nitrosarchaeum sp.]
MSKYQQPKMNVNFGKVKLAILGIIALVIIAAISAASVQIVESGNRGVLLHWSAVDTSVPPLQEGLHFVVPFQDKVVNMEVRTLKFVKATSGASRDLQTVSTEVTVNYRAAPNSVNVLYQEVGLDYEGRIIQPAVEEVVKQITAKYNAEELITKRPLVKADIETEITARLTPYNILTDAISITDFQFSPLFSQAIESKVEAEQKALKAENDLRRIEVEARQQEQQAKGIAAANVAEAAGEAEAIKIINEALAQNPNYLEWLKVQAWDGKLPLVVGEGGTPFIQIPTR